MVEAPFIGREAWTPMRRLYKIVSASNTRRQTSWASIDEAMSYVTKRQPCKGYHPEVWKVMAVRTTSRLCCSRAHPTILTDCCSRCL